MLPQGKNTTENTVALAPCLNCGSSSIELGWMRKVRSFYSTVHHGGGQCLDCGKQTMTAVSPISTKDDLAVIWNAANDIPSLISIEEQKIAAATERLAFLNAKLAKAGTQPAKDQA